MMPVQMVESSSSTQYEYDVYVSYPRQEGDWVRALGEQLATYGLRWFADVDLRPGEAWRDGMERALERSRILVVLWSAAAVQARGMLDEIIRFNALPDLGSEPRQILPVMLGGDHLLDTAPTVLTDRQALIVGEKAYEAGPDAAPKELERVAIAARELAVPGATIPEPKATPKIELGRGALAALTSATEMLGDTARSEAQRRVAALLGALAASSLYTRDSSSTSAIAELVSQRQRGGRTLGETIAAAAQAAGLLPPASHEKPEPLTAPQLEGGPAAELLRYALDVRSRTGARVIHLRHVMAAGIHPSVPSQVLDTLQIPRAELSTRWAEAIRVSTPDEPTEDWTSYLEQQARRDDAAGQTPPRDQSPDWVPDAPAHQDRLNRGPIAEMLATRLRRLQRDSALNPDGSSFLVHLDGPWGAGKTSILNFLRTDLTRTDRDDSHATWLVVEINAWRQANLGPSWWTLLTALRQELSRGLRWYAKLWLRGTEALQRLRVGGAPYALALAIVLTLGGALVLAVGPQRTISAGTATTITAIMAAIGAVWAAVLVATRFFMWDSPAGARLFEQSNRDPKTYLRKHFAWLAKRARRPVIFFIDDLDRCDQEYVVEFLDGIQTLVRDVRASQALTPDSHEETAGAGAADSPEEDKGTGAAGSGEGNHAAVNPFFVVAADGRWLRACYENAYATLAKAITRPGQSLGHLFLDKIFQLTITVPSLSNASQTRLVRQLLTQDPSGPATMEQEREHVKQAISNSTTSAQVRQAWKKAHPEVREEVAQLAVQKLTEPAIEAHTEHDLQKFARLLDRNPRHIKRFLNTYSANMVASGLDQSFPDFDSLALWTIVRMRWPVVADYLVSHPEVISSVSNVGPTGGAPQEVAEVLGTREFIDVWGFQPGGALIAELVENLAGVKQGEDASRDR